MKRKIELPDLDVQFRRVMSTRIRQSERVLEVVYHFGWPAWESSGKMRFMHFWPAHFSEGGARDVCWIWPESGGLESMQLLYRKHCLWWRGPVLPSWSQIIIHGAMQLGEKAKRFRRKHFTVIFVAMICICSCVEFDCILILRQIRKKVFLRF